MHSWTMSNPIVSDKSDHGVNCYMSSHVATRGASVVSMAVIVVVEVVVDDHELYASQAY